MTTTKFASSAHTPIYVADPALFTDAFQVVRKGFATAGAAAVALGIDRTRVLRLNRGEVGKWVKAGLLRAMRRELAGDEAALRLLDAAVLSESARAALKAHAEWNDTNFNRLHDASMVFTQLANHYAPFLSYVESFTSSLKRRGFNENTINRAILKALQPLGDAKYSGGIEMTLEELADKEKLGPYLKVALKREEILLSRTADVMRRAQEVTAPKAKPVARSRRGTRSQRA